jgi:hypothetical protein
MIDFFQRITGQAIKYLANGGIPEEMARPCNCFHGCLQSNVTFLNGFPSQPSSRQERRW